MATGRPAAQVRVKRCGKSAPAPGVTRVARQTPPGARPDRGSAARTQTPPGGLLEPAGNRRPRGMAAGGRASVRNRIRRIGRLTTTNEADQGARVVRKRAVRSLLVDPASPSVGGCGALDLHPQ